MKPYRNLARHAAFDIMYVIVLTFFFSSFNYLQTTGIYTSNHGIVKFVSKAPMEIIKAESKKLAGAINISKRTFVFTVPYKSFEGFNTSIQKEHFNEKYMESDKIPTAAFNGKLIDDVDFNTPGTYKVRAKGTMNIHGADKEMIIPCALVVKDGQITVSSDFSLLLGDFNIKVPKMVTEKIAEEIFVSVNIEMTERK